MSWLRIVGGAAFAAALTGCASGGPVESLSTPTTSPTAFPAQPVCDVASVKAALPATSTEMQMFTCAPLSNGYWAAATINPGPTTYFLIDNSGRWEQTDSPCGRNLPGMTDQIMDYCKS